MIICHPFSLFPFFSQELAEEEDEECLEVRRVFEVVAAVPEVVAAASASATFLRKPGVAISVINVCSLTIYRQTVMAAARHRQSPFPRSDDSLSQSHSLPVSHSLIQHEICLLYSFVHSLTLLFRIIAAYYTSRSFCVGRLIPIGPLYWPADFCGSWTM